MLKTEIKLSRFLGNHFLQLTADWTDEQLTLELAPGVNTPVWLLGHMAVTMDLGLELIGDHAQCPTEWHEMFGLGSTPRSMTAPFPVKTDLVKMFQSSHSRLLDAANRVPAELLASKHNLPIDTLQNYLPTVQDALSYLMTTQLAMDIGQMILLRRAAGLPPVT